MKVLIRKAKSKPLRTPNPKEKGAKFWIKTYQYRSIFMELRNEAA